MSDTEPIRLLPGEAIADIREVSVDLPDHLEDAHLVLARLCGAITPSQIGKRGPVMAAASPPGIHAPEFNLYNALFGRDALVTADLVGDRYPNLAEVTIRCLAELQACHVDPTSEAEPGRIPHEVRHPEDPLSHRLTQTHGWGWPFYGSVDATPLFVVTAGLVEERNPGFLSGEYLDRQGEIRTLAEATARAIDWLMHRLETPSGLIESTRTQPGSHVNQVWKDSFDSYHHWDGALATPDTVASVEVVAHAFDALHHAARLAARYPEAGWPAPARVLEEKARDLRLRVLRLCWVGEEGYFAIGVDRGADGRLRPLRIRTSNMGRLLDSEILAGREWRPYRDAIVSHLSSEEMLASAGVRTLAADSVRYRPGSYHNGSVWPFDSALIARGLRRHGYDDLAAELYRRVTSACSAMRCYPEYVRGDGPRHEINRCVVDVVDPSGRINRLYQPPQLFQAWTVAAVISAPYSTSRPDHEEDRSQINGTQSRLPHSQRGIEQVPPGNNQTRHQRSR